jgi:hypothetical protein
MSTTRMTVATDDRSLTVMVHESNGHDSTWVFNKE